MRTSGIKIGKLLGIEIFLDYSWFLIFALLIWLFSANYFPSLNATASVQTNIILAVITSVLLFASALTHELLHSIVANKNGLKINRITLFLFGGIAELFEEPDNARTEFRIAIAGPITSFVLAGIFFAIFFFTRGYNHLFNITVLAATMSQINLLFGMFNLLPGFPLDGGRILRSIAWGLTKNLKKATQIASDSGKIIAVLVIAFGILRIITTDLFSGAWLILIGLFLYQAAGQGYMELLIRTALEKVQIKQILNKNMLTVTPYLTINSLIEEFFLKYNVDNLPVILDNTVVGTISLDDIRKNSARITEETRVYEMMRSFLHNFYLQENDKVNDALKLIVSKNVGFVSILEENKLVGILTVDDIAKYLADKKVI